jgi:putative membrane protein
MNHRHDYLTLVAAAFAAALLSAQALADDPKFESAKTIPAAANPTFANPDTPGLLEGKPAEAANTVDIVFLKQLAIGNRAEVELGKLAGERSSVASIDRFGEHMVKDHGEAGSKVNSLARAAKVDLPKGLDAEHDATRKELQSLNGKEFDLRYVASQIKAHQKTAQLLIHEIASGQHTGVRQFAADTLPTVMQHLETAKNIHAELTGAAPPQDPAAP